MMMMPAELACRLKSAKSKSLVAAFQHDVVSFCICSLFRERFYMWLR